jgi:hypothetical protein
MPEEAHVRVHVGYAPVLRAPEGLTASELAEIAAELSLSNVRLRFGILSGDIDPEGLEALRKHPSVEWVEVDQRRNIN